MRVLSWIGGVILVAVISTATAATLRAYNDGTPALAASQPNAAATYDGTSFTPNLLANHNPPRPSPSPSVAPSTTSSNAPVASRPAPPPARPSIVIGSQQQVLINRDRAAVGLPPLTWSACLGHQAGENVGYWSGGINDSQLNSMFWASPEHHANIVGPYHYVATAWAVAPNGYAYIAVEFS